MTRNAETIRQLAKGVVVCLLVTLCSFGSRTWEDRAVLSAGIQSGGMPDTADKPDTSKPSNTLETFNTSTVSNTSKIDSRTVSKDRRDGIIGASRDVVSTVRWGSVVIMLAAIYYIQAQIWKTIWQRKQERGRRTLRRHQYRQTRTTPLQTPSHSQANSHHTAQTPRFSVEEEESDTSSGSLRPISEAISETDDAVEVATVISNDVYYPELTMSSIWKFVYLYGTLLFVCCYCLTGSNIPSSCWWVMGMVALSFDELISTRMNRWLICTILLCISLSVFSIWSVSLIDNEGNFIGDLMFSQTNAIPFFDFVMGVFLPVSTPLIFFSIRSAIRGVDRDVCKLFEFALPFMTVLAGCVLISSSGVCHVIRDIPATKNNNFVESTSSGLEPYKYSDTHHEFKSHQADSARRALQRIPLSRSANQGDQTRKTTSYRKSNTNTTSDKAGIHIETSAVFSEPHPLTLSFQYFSFTPDSNTTQYTILLISPFILFWAIHVVITSVHTGYTTEFISAFVLVNSVRYSIVHQVSIWSMISILGAGLAFSALIIGKRD